MTARKPNSKSPLKFSLLHMLVAMAIAALWFAAYRAYCHNRELHARKDVFDRMSSQLVITDLAKLAKAALPPVADDFESWNVYIPEGGVYELRLGVGEVSEAGVPADFERIQLEAGRQRITLHAADNLSQGYRFQVSVDGDIKIDKPMDRDWMPNAWSQSSGLNWPSHYDRDAKSMQIASAIYMPRPELGKGLYFNGNSDPWVTSPGYRLWIDEVSITHGPASAFVGFGPDHMFRGVGLRDGLRYRAGSTNSAELVFTRPASRVSESTLSIIAEFDTENETVVLDSNNPKDRWAFRQSPTDTKLDPAARVYSVSLQAEIQASKLDAPVVELRWDVQRPDDLGIRLAEVPANARWTRWRLRFVGGAEHLWRLLEVGDQDYDARQTAGKVAESTVEPFALVTENPAASPIQLSWKTDHRLPLQCLELGNATNIYAGMQLFQGLPVQFGIQLPAPADPVISLVRKQGHPFTSGAAFPGGSVIEEVRIELDAANRDWIWIRVEPRTSP